MKYLGVTVDSKLSWNKHIQQTASKAWKVLNLIKRNLHSGPSKLKRKCYDSLVLPILTYASVAWAPYTTSNESVLERVNRSAARITYRMYEKTDGCVTNLLREKE